MGVYIKGMMMPKNCCQCPVNMEVCKRGYEYLLAHTELYDKRADDCPLVPVPEHGRLIDADELKADYFVPSTTSNSPCWLYVSMEEIKNAPTIIPASFENLPKNARYSQDNPAEERE